jgi:hypothetical protein
MAKRPSFGCETIAALLLFLANEKAKYFFAEDWTRRANQVDGIYQQRHARMFKRLRCRRATIGCYVAPLSSSAKADDPVPRGGPVTQPASPLDPSPAERAGRVARRERKRTACRVGVQEKAPPWPRFASAFPPHCSLTLAGRDGNDRRCHPMKRRARLTCPLPSSPGFPGDPRLGFFFRRQRPGWPAVIASASEART